MGHAPLLPGPCGYGYPVFFYAGVFRDRLVCGPVYPGRAGRRVQRAVPDADEYAHAGGADRIHRRDDTTATAGRFTGERYADGGGV